MNQDKQPEALRLADAVLTHNDHPRVHFYNRVSAELRTQHTRIAEIEAELAAVQQGVQPAWFVQLTKNGEPVMHLLPEIAEKYRADIEKIGGTLQPLYTHPTQQGRDATTQAASSVIAERARQIAAEGYTPEQDDGYNPGVLALHGGLYACHAYDNLTKKRAPEGWQWDEKWWKPKDPRSNLVKAGALVLAEIERIDRVCAAQAKQGGV